MEQRLLLISTPFQLVPKSTTLDDLEQQLGSSFE